jgi:hypothetical protein
VSLLSSVVLSKGLWPVDCNCDPENEIPIHEDLTSRCYWSAWIYTLVAIVHRLGGKGEFGGPSMYSPPLLPVMHKLRKLQFMDHNLTYIFDFVLQNQREGSSLRALTQDGKDGVEFLLPSTCHVEKERWSSLSWIQRRPGGKQRTGAGSRAGR